MGERSRILLVDDDPNHLRLLAIRLQRAGYEVETAPNGKKAISVLPTFRPHLVVTDVRMEEMDGLSLFDAIHSQQATLPVVMLTAHGTIPDAVAATQRGVFAYLTKPFQSEELLTVVQRALRAGASAVSEQHKDGTAQWRSAIITRSPAMETLLAAAFKVAKTSANVLIQGGSGTGKELLAKAIHKASNRAKEPFVPVNCTAIPEAMFESELFGHQKGSFTGAFRDRPGLLQAAHGGTLFLDEIGDMPLDFQAKMLRALQEREFRPVGTTQTLKVDLRVISATNKNLEAAVAARDFREDLYYRLNVVALDMPPLAERREDIALLAEHFLGEIKARDGSEATAARSFSPEAMEVLLAAPWPGNVRQLRNVVEQCAVLCSSSLISATLVHNALRAKERALLSFEEARDRFELDYLIRLLQLSDGNVAQAARIAERSRSEFYRLIRKHGLDPEMFRRSTGEDH